MTLLVPYRDREEHLKEFIPAMKDHDIYIIEQADDNPFNRGKLINVGFLETAAEYFIAHDVDLICSDKRAYEKRPSVNQLCKSTIQLNHYLGGATMYYGGTFVRAGGYHNDYFHRAEDNEMRFNLHKKQILVYEWNFQFTTLKHQRPPAEFDPVLWQKAQQPRTKDMLKTCEYQLISKEVKDGYTHLRVLL